MKEKIKQDNKARRNKRKNESQEISTNIKRKEQKGETRERNKNKHEVKRNDTKQTRNIYN